MQSKTKKLKKDCRTLKKSNKKEAKIKYTQEMWATKRKNDELNRMKEVYESIKDTYPDMVQSLKIAEEVFGGAEEYANSLMWKELNERQQLALEKKSLVQTHNPSLSFVSPKAP